MARGKIQIDTVTGVAKVDEEPPRDMKSYDLSTEDYVCGGGEPMEKNFLIRRIKERFADILKKYNDAKDEDNQTAISDLANEHIAIMLGKESLLLLLSQKDCEGIRFYFCKNPKERNSIAAVGVRAMRDKSGKALLDKKNAQIAQDIGVNDHFTSILTSKQMDPLILNFEVGPPYGLGEYVEEMKGNQPSMFAVELSKIAPFSGFL